MHGAYGNVVYGCTAHMDMRPTGVRDEWRIWICALRKREMNGAFGNAPYRGAGCVAHMDMRPTEARDERRIWKCALQGRGMRGAYGYAPYGGIG